MDHVSTMQFFSLPQFPQPAKVLLILSGCRQFLHPRFTNLEGQQEDFLRGYGIWGGVQRGEYSRPVTQNRSGGHWLFSGLWRSAAPQTENRVQLDSDRVDAWGIPSRSH